MWLAAAVVVGGVGWVSYDLSNAWHKFSIEDQVHDKFFPVVTALNKYQEESGAPATNLSQLVPRYLSGIPSSSIADSLEYQILPDGTNWQLSIYSRALNPARVYVHRSSGQFTADEQRKELTRFHTWTVFRQQ